MPRWPTDAFTTHRTGCYKCVRKSPEDGGCGVHPYPCTHYGMDLFATTPNVVAPESGVVAAVSDGTVPPWMGFGPGIVVLRGDSGVFHLLAHLRTIKVARGQRLLEGAPIGAFDKAYGHTHYEVRRQLTGPSETNTIDPAVWLAHAQAQAYAQLLPGSGAGSRSRLATFAIGLGVTAATAGAMTALWLGWRSLTARPIV